MIWVGLGIDCTVIQHGVPAIYGKPKICMKKPDIGIYIYFLKYLLWLSSIAKLYFLNRSYYDVKMYHI